jgi:hypothetical protein
LEVGNYTRENTREKIVTEIGIHGGKVAPCSGYSLGAFRWSSKGVSEAPFTVVDRD